MLATLALLLPSSPVAAPAAAAPAGAGDVLVVDAAGGPGVDFTSLSAALEAARLDDTLLVRSGTYAPTAATPQLQQAAFLVRRGVRIVAEEGADVVLASPLWVLGLPPEETVYVRGLTLAPIGANGANLSVLVNSSNSASTEQAGTLWVEDATVVAPAGIYFLDMVGGGPGTQAVLVQRASLVMRGCTVQGGDALPIAAGGSIEPWYLQDAPLMARSSTVHLYDSTFSTGSGTYSTEPAAVLSGSALFASGCRFEGSDGAAGILFLGVQFCGESGLPGVLLEAGGADSHAAFLDCELLGGAAGNSPAGCTPPGAGMPVAGLPVELGAGSAELLPGTARSLAGPRTVVASTPGALALAGLPGDVALLGVAAGAAPILELDFLVGPALLSTPATVLLAGALDAGGQLSFPFVAPALAPGAEAESAHVQAFFFDGATLTASGGSLLTFLDAGL